MVDAADMIIPLLREMRAENAARDGEALERFELVDGRLKALEEAQVSFKQALTADSLLSKLVQGSSSSASKRSSEKCGNWSV